MQYLRSIVLALAVFLGVPVTHRADTQLITLVGHLGNGTNISFFADTPLPVPYVLEVAFDTNAVDEDPSLLRGEYMTEGALVRLSFGRYVFETTNSEVLIWAGVQGLYGVTFGNEDGFSAYGFDVAPYWIYASIVDATNPAMALNDSLSQMRTEVFDLGTASYFLIANDDYANGGAFPIRLQGNIETMTLTNAVPEPGVMGLLVVGCFFLLTGRRCRP